MGKTKKQLSHCYFHRQGKSPGKSDVFGVCQLVPHFMKKNPPSKANLLLSQVDKLVLHSFGLMKLYWKWISLWGVALKNNNQNNMEVILICKISKQDSGVK